MFDQELRLFSLPKHLDLNLLFPRQMLTAKMVVIVCLFTCTNSGLQQLSCDSFLTCSFCLKYELLCYIIFCIIIVLRFIVDAESLKRRSLLQKCNSMLLLLAFTTDDMVDQRDSSQQVIYLSHISYLLIFILQGQSRRQYLFIYKYCTCHNSFRTLHAGLLKYL